MAAFGAVTVGGWQLASRPAPSPAASALGEVQPFSAVFEVPGTRLELDYASPGDFRIGVPGGAATLVAGGEVYVLQPLPGGGLQAFWVDSIRDRHAGTPARPLLSPVEPMRRLEGGRWTGRFGIAGGSASVGIELAELPALAQAQWAIQQTLDRMDMAMCSLALRYLLDWWPPQFTSRGLAVVTTDAGLRLLTAPQPLTQARWPTLPSSAPVADLRPP